MKLIIDIPDKVYEICKRMTDDGDARCAEWHIANGIPYEERPQGEWIYTDKEDKEKGYGGYCSVLNFARIAVRK